MIDKHLENCSAPICARDPNPNYKKEVIWYPGESICNSKPHQPFQRKQIDINRSIVNGEFVDINKPYIVSSLESRHRKSLIL